MEYRAVLSFPFLREFGSLGIPGGTGTPLFFKNFQKKNSWKNKKGIVQIEKLVYSIMKIGAELIQIKDISTWLLKIFLLTVKKQSG